MNGCHVKPEQFFNLIFGYNDRYFELAQATSSDGTTNVYSSTVPAGEVWVVTSVSLNHNDTTARVCRIMLEDGVTVYNIADIGQLSGEYILDRQGWWVLKAGDRFRGRALALGAGKVITMCLNGFKMKVTQ